MGRKARVFVDIDEALLSFGKRRATARKAYSERLAASRGADTSVPGFHIS